jgi:DNA-binding NarL/FixJ family response regulator
MATPLQVYVVEDSPILQQLLASAVAAAGAELSGCSADAETALADLFALEPDLILIDIRLASGSGFDVLRVLQDQSRLPKAIKVVLSNYADAEYENLSVRFGADRFFDKSFEISKAVALISTLAAEKRAVDVFGVKRTSLNDFAADARMAQPADCSVDANGPTLRPSESHRRLG